MSQAQTTDTPFEGFVPCDIERVLIHDAKFKTIEDKLNSSVERQIKMESRIEEMYKVLCVSNGKRSITDSVSNNVKQIEENKKDIKIIQEAKVADDKDIKKHIVTGVFTLAIAWVVSKIGGGQ